jgi:hypothetical protein
MRSHRWLSRRLRPARALPALLLLCGAAAISCGCASPGEPTPRRPIIPQPIQDLQARQQGASVLLNFTLPTQSTRNEPLALPPAIEIYRGEVAAGKTAEKTATKLVYTIPGEMAGSYVADGRMLYRDALEPGAAAGTERVYLVRTRAARNRASAESNRVAVRVYPAPATISNVTARVAGQSVTLTWARAENASYRVYRAEIAPESMAASADAANAVLRMPLVQVAQMGAPADGGAGSPQYHDENVELGHAYLYIVRAVAQFGADTVESADSAPAAITVTEAVPPAAPQDVEAVVVPAAGTAPGYVSLSWAISPEAGVAGYAVYRSEQEGVRGVRLNQEPVGSPTYRDESVAAGRRYFYSITSVDAGGQESDASAPAAVDMPARQP